MKKLRFGIIGCGLMGREFACAAARWMGVLEDTVRPEIIAVADTNVQAMDWFIKNIPSVCFYTQDYRELLEREDLDAVYCAVPHILHEQVYTDTIKAGKHLMGEKPFGIDREANRNILRVLAEHPNVFCRCSSQFPFYPAMGIMEDWIRNKKFGQIIEVKAGFLHSSDMDLTKTINWKRKAEINGKYGCMGDLGIHVQHIPLRYGWLPKSVSAILSNIVPERPDGKGGKVPCDTYDNAALFCRAQDPDGSAFPMTLEMKRMSPGSTNEWYLKVLGLDASAYFTTDDPGAFHYLKSDGAEQAWTRINVGYKPQFKSITGGIFEFGFGDAILQMWTAFIMEYEGRNVKFGCVRPEETRASHAILTAALQSHERLSEITVDYE